MTETNAGSIKVTGSNGTSYSLPYSGGSITVSPSSTTTYTATATNGSGSATAETTITVKTAAPTASMTADSSTITSGNSSTLYVSATNATSIVVTGADGTDTTLTGTGGTVKVSPTATTIYTADATGSGGTASTTATVTVIPASDLSKIQHVVFMLQENHAFDNYFGMLNPYRTSNGWDVSEDGKEYTVDGIDDKLSTISNENDSDTVYKLYKFRSTCIDDDSSDWLSSYGDVNRYDFLATRPIQMSGFVHTAEGYATSCSNGTTTCDGDYTDTAGERAMGYYDQTFLNYYYYMAAQFALSDRWFSPIASKSVPNRIAVFTGGTTQGLVHDPGANDHLPQLDINNIFEELDNAGVSWKIYYTVTEGYCLDEDDCSGTGSALYPAEHFSNLSYSIKYLYENPSKAACKAPTQASSVVGDSTNSFCIDPAHIAPVSQYFSDLTNGDLASFSFIEAGYGRNDEHPGSGQTILDGQAQVASVVNALMSSSEWKSSVFFLSYDEGGGPYDHVPPVPGHSNDFTDASLGTIPDISTIAVNPDSYNPCLPSGGTPTLHCDLTSSDPGAHSGDAAAENGFAAQLGFRLPNIVISPFARKHYVSHLPMDHTAVIKFVENRFISSSAHLTNRDAAQPDLLDFFDFTNVPWATPPSPPTPASEESLGYNSCNASEMGP
ncbi:MAG: alkaline phosphatase family protein [Terracidiphilus sp.]